MRHLWVNTSFDTTSALTTLPTCQRCATLRIAKNNKSKKIVKRPLSKTLNLQPTFYRIIFQWYLWCQEDVILFSSSRNFWSVGGKKFARAVHHFLHSSICLLVNLSLFLSVFFCISATVCVCREHGDGRGWGRMRGVMDSETTWPYTENWLWLHCVEDQMSVVCCVQRISKLNFLTEIFQKMLCRMILLTHLFILLLKTIFSHRVRFHSMTIISNLWLVMILFLSMINDYFTWLILLCFQIRVWQRVQLLERETFGKWCLLNFHWSCLSNHLSAQAWKVDIEKKCIQVSLRALF